MQFVHLVSVKTVPPGWRDAGDGGQRWSRGLERQELDYPESNISAGGALPQCDFKVFWDQALKMGVPADALAHIHHGAKGYMFYVEGTSHHYFFGQDCKMLKRAGQI